MPTYHYRCKSCSHEFEEIQKFSDDPLVKCPACRKNKLVRIIGGAGLVFKGSGFYLTDYKKASGTGESASASSTSTEKKSDTKETSKPAESASSKPKKKDSTSPKKE
jgi:putative FmdB family regulatory protein